MVVLAEPKLADSIGVIGDSERNTRLSAEKESFLIQQVNERFHLLKQKSPGFTAQELRIKRLGEAALSELLDANQYLIRRLVRDHQPKDLLILPPDLEHEAITTFIDAIQRFDPSRGARLSSYAYFRIRAKLQELRDETNEQSIAFAKSCYEPKSTAAPEPENVYEHDLLRRAITTLPERQQQAVELHLQESSSEMIAKELDSGPRALQGVMYRAKKKLHSILSALLPERLAAASKKRVIRVAAAGAIETMVAAEAPAKRWPRPRLPKISKLARGFFAKEPITPIEPNQFSALIDRPPTESLQAFPASPVFKPTYEDFFMPATKVSRRAVSQPQSSQYRLPSRTQKRPTLLSRVARYLPPLWLNLGLLTVATYFAQDTFFDSITISLWLAVFYLYGIGKLAQYVSLNLRHRLWFTSLGAASIGLVSSPQLILAQAATDTGGGACPNAGFLNKLAAFSTGVLTSNSGATVNALNSFMCQFIGLLALIAIVMMVGGFIYAGFEITVRQQALATVAQPVVGIVVTVIFCVVVIAIMTNPV